MEIYITGEVGPINDYSTIRSKPSFMRKIELPDGVNPLDYVWDGNEASYDEFVSPEAELTEFAKFRKEMNKRQDMTDAAMLELADIVLKGGD